MSSYARLKEKQNTMGSEARVQGRPEIKIINAGRNRIVIQAYVVAKDSVHVTAFPFVVEP